MKHLLYFLFFLSAFSAVAQTYTGTLTTASPSFDSPDPNGSNPPFGYAVGTYYYQLISIPVKTAGVYTFDCTTNFQYGGEGILYQDPGPVPDADQITGASIKNALVAVGSKRPDFTLVKSLGVGQYYFAVSTYAEKMTGSFKLTVTAPAPLPVRLTSFTAQAQTAGVRLAWSTASETQNAFFIVERSLDGQLWQLLTQVAGQGTSLRGKDYSWLDAAALDGLAYYRLRQVDTDGKTTYSSVISLARPLATQVSFFPNPVLSRVTFNCPAATTILVRDVLGHPCKTLRLNSGNQQVSLDDLPAGLYLLTDEMTHQTSRLIKGVL